MRLPVEAKTKHVHVVGGSGTGKSTLLARMILEDIEAGHGVGVLDPHGDLVEEVAARVPEHRSDDVILFDPADEHGAIGWNILRAHSTAEREMLSSDLVAVFRRLSTSWGDQMTAVLGNAILVFLEHEGGGTLLDLRRFLIEEAFRREMLAEVEDSYLRSFWQVEFPLLVGRRPQAPILTRLDTFLRSRLVRRVVTAGDEGLDFREVTDRGLIFLGKLSAGAIGEENAALLGSLVVSKFHQVTLTREAQAASARRPFFLYIDEFHEVATPSMASLFSGARKYGLGLTVAHQDLYQLHRTIPEVERSLLVNAYTRVCFRVGEEDARTLERGMSFFTADDLMRLPVGEAICRVGGREGDFNLAVERLPELDPTEAREQREALREHSARRFGRKPTEPGLATKEATEPREAVPVPTGPAPHTRPLTTHEEPARAPQTPKPEDSIDKLALDYLALVAASPFLTVRERNDKLGLSAWRGHRVKGALIRDGLASEVAINPGGRGERFKLLDLTPEGRALLSRFGVPLPRGYGRGGIAHQWWARRVSEWLSEHGVVSEIEDGSSGARADLTCRLGAERVALEIELSDGHVPENVRKDLAAGFDRVVLLLGEEVNMERVRAKLGEIPPSVTLGDLQSFEALIAPLLPNTPPLRGPNQNEERRPQRRPLSRQVPAQVPPEPALQALLDPGAFSTPHAAEYLGLSPATLETLRCRGGGPVFVKLGRRVVYRREDLDAWTEQARRASTSADSAPKIRPT